MSSVESPAPPVNNNQLDPVVAQALEQYRIKDLPKRFYYIPNFISEEEETSILSKVSVHVSAFEPVCFSQP